MTRGYRGGQRKENPGKLTGLFTSKSNRDLLTGRINGKYLDNLISIIKEAKRDNPKEPSVVFFCWKNQYREGPEDPLFNLTAAVSQEQTGGRTRRPRASQDEDMRPARRRIEPDTFEDNEAKPESSGGNADNDPFDDDDDNG